MIVLELEKNSLHFPDNYHTFTPKMKISQTVLKRGPFVSLNHKTENL